MNKKLFLALCLLVGISGSRSQAFAQLRVVDNPAPLNSDQREVLILVEQAQKLILDDNAPALMDMFDWQPVLANDPRQDELENFWRRFREPGGFYSCIVFDTGCVSGLLKEASGNHIGQNKPLVGADALRASEVFVSVKDFLEKHKAEMLVTFQPQPIGQIQAELHIPRRVDASQVPPPFGTYESISLGFVKTIAGWKINLLFPEPYRIVLPLL